MFFFLAFSQLNISWRFELITLSFYFRKFQDFFAIIFNKSGKMVIRVAFFSVSTTRTIKYCTKTWHFEILISFPLSLQPIFSPIPAQPLFLYVLHNDVKNIHLRKTWFVTCYLKEEYSSQCWNNETLDFQFQYPQIL